MRGSNRGDNPTLLDQAVCNDNLESPRGVLLQLLAHYTLLDILRLLVLEVCEEKKPQVGNGDMSSTSRHVPAYMYIEPPGVGSSGNIRGGE